MSMNFKFQVILLTFLCAVFLSCDKEEECTTTCPTGQALTLDCTCVTVDPCANVTCDPGFVCSEGTCVSIVNDPCANVTCNPGFVCTNGNCVEVVNTVKIDRNISSNETWTKDKIYILATRVTVLSGATLTIQAGTVIKGEAGSGANATALLVARGGKLMAEGTASEPIIFTSVADEIMPGEIAGPNLDPTLNGLWGGIIVLGSAPISAVADAIQIEGIPPSDQNGLYGGNDPNDNSGVIRYISIRHGGANIGEGNEINGLTLGGVGKGTVIEYVEVIANADDGVE